MERAANPDTEEGSHSAKVLIVLAEASRTPAGHEQVQEDLRERVRVPGIASLEFSSPALFSFANPIEVEILGHELPILARLAREVEQVLSELRRDDGSPLLADVRSSVGRGTREVLLTYDRERLARFSLTTGDVAQALRHKVSGEVATTFREQDRRIDIVTRVREQDADTIDEVLDLLIARRTGRDITLRDITREIVEAEGPTEIRRINHRRAAVVSAVPTGLDLARAASILEERLASVELPQGFKLSIGGQFREMERSSGSLLFALALASFLVYVVMASQFEHLVQPLVIMVSLPLAAVGVIFALYLTGTPLSVLVFIGLIILAGIVVNNAIVLVDYTNQLRRDRGLERDEAVRQAGAVRLRPILMTTTTTVIALIPMALGLGEGGELRAPLAVTVVAGLLSSTLLTLVVIPVVYTLADDLVRRAGGSGEASSELGGTAANS